MENICSDIRKLWIYQITSITSSPIFFMVVTSDGEDEDECLKFDFRVSRIRQKKIIWTRICLNLLPNFLLYWIIFQNLRSTFDVCFILKNHQIWQKIGKNWRKICFQPSFRVSISITKMSLSLQTVSCFTKIDFSKLKMKIAWV